jgi:hypothetical protein
MSELPKVAICYPSSDMVHADFTLALAGLCLAAHPLPVTVINAKSSIVAEARNNGVEEARGSGAEYLLFLDSDMVFPLTLLHRLLLHRKDIVGAVYTRRQAPYSLLGKTLDSQPDPETTGCVEMARLPTGCMLIRMAVFDALPKPYFFFGINHEQGTLLGEDYAFCDAARAAGFRIWADLNLSQEIGHIGQRVCRIAETLGRHSVLEPARKTTP